MLEITTDICPLCKRAMTELRNWPAYDRGLVDAVKNKRIAICDIQEFDELPFCICLACVPEWSVVSQLTLRVLELEKQFVDTETTNGNAISAIDLMTEAEEKRESALRIAETLLGVERDVAFKQETRRTGFLTRIAAWPWRSIKRKN